MKLLSRFWSKKDEGPRPGRCAATTRSGKPCSHTVVPCPIHGKEAEEVRRKALNLVHLEDEIEEGRREFRYMERLHRSAMKWLGVRPSGSTAAKASPGPEIPAKQKQSSRPDAAPIGVAITGITSDSRGLLPQQESCEPMPSSPGLVQQRDVCAPMPSSPAREPLKDGERQSADLSNSNEENQKKSNPSPEGREGSRAPMRVGDTAKRSQFSTITFQEWARRAVKEAHEQKHWGRHGPLSPELEKISPASWAVDPPTHDC